MWLNIIICGIWNKRQSKCLNLSNCLITTILLIPFYGRLRSLNKSRSSEVQQRGRDMTCALSFIIASAYITFCYYILDIFLLIVFGNHSTFVCFLVLALFYKICFFGACYRDKASHIFWISRAGFYQINAWLLIIHLVNSGEIDCNARVFVTRTPTMNLNANLISAELIFSRRHLDWRLLPDPCSG